MADDFVHAVYLRGVQENNAALLEAQSRFQRAELTRDTDAGLAAAADIKNIINDNAQLEALANQHYAAQAMAPRQNPHGLSDAQMEAAAITGTDPDTYAEGVRVLNYYKSLGMYRE